MSVPSYVNVRTANVAVLLAISVAILTNGVPRWRRMWPWSAMANDSQEDADYIYLLQGQEVSVQSGRGGEHARPDASRAMTIFASGSVQEDDPVAGRPVAWAGDNAIATLGDAAAKDTLDTPARPRRTIAEDVMATSESGAAVAAEPIQDQQRANATVEISKSQAAVEVGEVEEIDFEPPLGPSVPKAVVVSFAQKAMRVVADSGRKAEYVHSAFRAKVVKYLHTQLNFWAVMAFVLFLSAISLFIMYVIAIRDTTGAPVRNSQASFYQIDPKSKQSQTQQASASSMSKGDLALDPLSPYESFQSPQGAALATGSPPSPAPATYVRHSLPLPLCPSLVLPKNEARFAVPVASLSDVGTRGELQVVGTSGSPLLGVRIEQVGAGRKLVVSMAHPSGSPRATIGPLTGGKVGCGELEIRNSYNEVYGRLVLQSDDTYLVMVEGKSSQCANCGNPYMDMDYGKSCLKCGRPKNEVMIIGGRAGSLKLEVMSGDRGRPFASVTCGPEGFNGVDHLEVLVYPSVDPVLVLSCVLAVILLF